MKTNENAERSQTTDTLLMIEPVAFGFNKQTALNNYFQNNLNTEDSAIHENALFEFDNLMKVLRANDVNIITVKDTFEPHTPDSIFPNNWISFHGEGQVVLYPMFAENRRNERRKDILDSLTQMGCEIKNIDDFTFWEDQNLFLEGTGSMILDRVNRIAYACLSERTDKSVFLQFCKVFEFKPVYFNAFHTVNNKRQLIYHTNVMMNVGTQFAVICTESIDNKEERKNVLSALENSGKEIIIISEEQMQRFAGNMLQIKNKEGKLLLLMSQSAYDSLENEQIVRLTTYNEIIKVPIPTIEKVGGGSVRCMVAEIF